MMIYPVRATAGKDQNEGMHKDYSTEQNMRKNDLMGVENERNSWITGTERVTGA